jgi:signal transduction histidine kinase
MATISLKGSVHLQRLIDAVGHCKRAHPSIDVVVWEHKEAAQQLNVVHSTCGVLGIDVNSDECIPGHCLSNGDFGFDTLEQAKVSLADRFVNAASYKRNGWQRGALYQICDSHGEKVIAVLGIFGSPEIDLGSFKLAANATAPLIRCMLAMIMELEEFGEQARRLETNVFTLNTAEVASQYLHDIKDELNIMSATLSQLERYVDESSRGAVTAKTALNAQLRHAQILSGEFVTQSRRNQMAREIIDAHDILRRRADFHRLDADRRHISFAMMIGDRPVYVVGDKYRLGSLFNNVISNAMYFVRQRGLNRRPRVEIKLWIERGLCCTSVFDNGPGIRDKKLIFRAGYSTRGGGSGLGLPMCQDIVRRHDGTLQVDSVPGAWSKFTIRLPLSAEAPLPKGSKARRANAPQRVG